MAKSKGLILALVALAAVIALAAAGYKALGGQQGAKVELTPTTSTAASADTGAQASASTEAQENKASDNAQGTESGETQEGGSSDAQEQEYVQLADFTVQDLEGNDVKLSSIYGKPALLGFWATWCPPCNAEAPELQKLYERYGDQVNFLMVDSASDGRDTPEVVNNWLKEGGYTYPVCVDQSGEAALAGQVYYLPTMFVLDAQGNVLTSFSGALDEESGSQLIEQMLALHNGA